VYGILALVNSCYPRGHLYPDGFELGLFWVLPLRLTRRKKERGDYGKGAFSGTPGRGPIHPTSISTLKRDYEYKPTLFEYFHNLKPLIGFSRLRLPPTDLLRERVWSSRRLPCSPPWGT
jgi:hypothetical protein